MQVAMVMASQFVMMYVWLPFQYYMIHARLIMAKLPSLFFLLSVESPFIPHPHTHTCTLTSPTKSPVPMAIFVISCWKSCTVLNPSDWGTYNFVVCVCVCVCGVWVKVVVVHVCSIPHIQDQLAWDHIMWDQLLCVSVCVYMWGGKCEVCICAIGRIPC